MEELSNMATKIKLKRGLLANVPVLDEGELAFTTDTKKLLIGTSLGNQKIDTIYGINVGSNTNFANSTSWVTTNSSFTVANNEATVLATAYGGGISETLNVIAGHKYYFKASVKTDLPVSPGKICLEMDSSANRSDLILDSTSYYTLSTVAIPAATAATFKIIDLSSSG